MNHKALIKLGQAIGACAMAETKLNGLKGLSFNQETKDFLVSQMKAAQNHIIEVSEILDDAEAGASER